MRQSAATSLEQARTELKAALDQGLKTLPDVAYEQPWAQTELNGHNALTATVSYKIPAAGTVIPVWSCTYSVLRSGYILSFTVSGPSNDETRQIAETMKSSVEIRDPAPASH